MTIETTFGFGNKVYFLNNNKIEYGTVTEVHAVKGPGKAYISYKVNFLTDITMPEERCFRTKEELLETLISTTI